MGGGGGNDMFTLGWQFWQKGMLCLEARLWMGIYKMNWASTVNHVQFVQQISIWFLFLWDFQHITFIDNLCIKMCRGSKLTKTMMRSGRRWGRLEIHADTGRKIWGTHVVKLSRGRGGGEGVLCEINTAAHRASQRKVVFKIAQFNTKSKQLHYSTFLLQLIFLKLVFLWWGLHSRADVSPGIKVSCAPRAKSKYAMCVLAFWILSPIPFGTELYVHVRAFFCKQLENCFFLVLDYVFTLKSKNWIQTSNMLIINLFFTYIELQPCVEIIVRHNVHLAHLRIHVPLNGHQPGENNSQVAKVKTTQNLIMVGSPLALAVACA